MNRKYELTKEEFAFLANTDAMVVFMSNKYEINIEQGDYIREHATLPFHIRPAGYLEENDIAYFSSSEEAIRFQLHFEKQDGPEVPIPGRITDIHSKIRKD